MATMDVKPISADRVRLLDRDKDAPIREELLEMARQIYRCSGVYNSKTGIVADEKSGSVLLQIRISEIRDPP